jgi:hypothetical protein
MYYHVLFTQHVQWLKFRSDIGGGGGVVLMKKIPEVTGLLPGYLIWDKCARRKRKKPKMVIYDANLK